MTSQKNSRKFEGKSVEEPNKKTIMQCAVNVGVLGDEGGVVDDMPPWHLARTL